jgi:hypothetical protein
MKKSYKLYFGDINKIHGVVKKRKEKEYPYSKREKKISLLTVGGAGAGFVVGGLTGGLVGMWAGVPIGTFAGNIIARKSYPQKGRKPYYKPSLFKQLTTPREDLRREKEDIYRIERARVKSERTAPKRLYAKRRRR